MNTGKKKKKKKMKTIFSWLLYVETVCESTIQINEKRELHIFIQVKLKKVLVIILDR